MCVGSTVATAKQTQSVPPPFTARRQPTPGPLLGQGQRRRRQAHLQAEASRARFATMGALRWYLPLLASLSVLQSVAIGDKTEMLYD